MNKRLQLALSKEYQVANKRKRQLLQRFWGSLRKTPEEPESLLRGLDDDNLNDNYVNEAVLRCSDWDSLISFRGFVSGVSASDRSLNKWKQKIDERLLALLKSHVLPDLDESEWADVARVISQLPFNQSTDAAGSMHDEVETWLWQSLEDEADWGELDALLSLLEHEYTYSNMVLNRMAELIDAVGPQKAWPRWFESILESPREVGDSRVLDLVKAWIKQYFPE